MENEKKKGGFLDTPLMRTKIKSANATLFPEGLLGYLVGPTLALLANSIISGYFNRYMTDVLKITSWAAPFFSALPLISVIFVVLGNILVGRLLDHGKSRAGKARPLLLLSVPISVLALLTLFVISPFADNASDATTQLLALIFIAIGYNLWFSIAYPFYYTPHAALVNLSTRNSKDRSLLATISNATALAAMGLTSMILPFFLGLLFVENPDGTLNQQASYDHWKIFVIALMIITAVGALIEYFFTRERVTEESFDKGLDDTQKKAVPLGTQAKICFKDKFWIIMIIFFFLYQLGGMLKNVSQLYFCAALFTPDNSTAAGGAFQGTLSIIGAIPTAVGMVIAWPLSNKIGKGKAILFGAILSVIGGAIGFIDPTNFVLVVVSFVVKALGSTPAMYLSLALLADTLDHQEALHGVRTDGLTMTIYGAIMAGMTGLATGVMNIVLSAIHYSEITVPTPALQTAMTWLFIGGETVCYLLIFIIFIFMGVEKFSSLDHKAIVADQKAEAEAEGRAYIDPAEKLKMEEAEAERASDEARKVELAAYCQKKGLDFEEEEAKYQAGVAERAATEQKRKEEAEQRQRERDEREAARIAALPEEERLALEAKKQADEALKAERERAVLAEFNALREKNGRTLLTTDEA